MKKPVMFFLGMLASLCATVYAASYYNVFSPGGALSGTWNSQSVNLTASSFILNQLPVASGGSGAATLAAHSVLLGEGASAISNVGALAADTLLQGQGVSADPAGVALVNCGDSTHGLAYSTSSHAFSCQAITGSGLPTQANNTLLGNVSGSTATPVALTGLQSNLLLNTQLVANARCTANIASLSGLQTCDGITGAAGEVVLLLNQTTNTQNGLWAQASGAWTRPASFPSGGVIPAASTVSILVGRGANNQGVTFTLATTSSVTIDTSAITVATSGYIVGTTGNTGVVVTTNNSGTNKVAQVTIAPVVTKDCVSSTDANGSIGDNTDASNTVNGPCVIDDAATGHVVLYGTGTLPTLSAGTAATKSSDNRGTITGLTGVTSVTVTFNKTFSFAPACVASDSASTAVGVSAVSTTAVTFAMASLTGSLYYICL